MESVFGFDLQKRQRGTQRPYIQLATQIEALCSRVVITTWPASHAHACTLLEGGSHRVHKAKTVSNHSVHKGGVFVRFKRTKKNPALKNQSTFDTKARIMFPVNRISSRFPASLSSSAFCRFSLQGAGPVGAAGLSAARNVAAESRCAADPASPRTACVRERWRKDVHATPSPASVSPPPTTCN